MLRIFFNNVYFTDTAHLNQLIKVLAIFHTGNKLLIILYTVSMPCPTFLLNARFQVYIFLYLALFFLLSLIFNQVSLDRKVS